MNKKIKDLFFISFLISIILIVFFQIGLLNNINLKLTDNLYGSNKVINDIIILKVDDKSINKIGRWPWERNVYVNLLDKLNSSKVIGIDIGFFENSKNTSADNQLEKKIINSNNIILASQYTNFKLDSKNNKLIGNEILKPIFNISNDKIGYINVIKDRDGVVRSLNFNIQGKFKSFSNAIYNKYFNTNFKYNENKYLINFANKPFSFNSYSIIDVLENKIEQSTFKNKIILIGATSSNLHDDFLVPTSSGINMPGVEIHANTIQTMILNNNLEHQKIMSLFICILLSSLIVGFIAQKIKFILSLIITIFLIILWIFISIFIFKYNIILNLVYVPLSILISFTSITGYNYIIEEKKKKEIHNAFGKYVSPKIINEIIKNPNKLKLGGERKNVTIFFSDIASFTNLSEQLKPEELVHFLNIYLTKMTNIISQNEGIVDKYIGDAIMAFWGAPISFKNQRELACITSLEMIKCRDKISNELNLKNYKFDFRIGLNYGKAIVGNMGSDERFDYTLIGDNINLASRLESVNKQYNTNIIVSENIYKKVKNKFVFRELDLIKVKGKNIPVRIYELIDYKINFNKYKNKLILFEKGLKLYRKQDFKQAIKVFEENYKKHNDKCSKIFINRCLELRNKKLPKNWNGVYVMKTK